MFISSSQLNKQFNNNIYIYIKLSQCERKRKLGSGGGVDANN